MDTLDEYKRGVDTVEDSVKCALCNTRWPAYRCALDKNHSYYCPECDQSGAVVDYLSSLQDYGKMDVEYVINQFK